MKKIILAILVISFMAVVSTTGCRPDPSLAAPDTSMLISFAVPEGWPQPAYSFQTNQLTQKGFELGRKLFYDPRLSRDNTISCNSCHEQFSAFSHLDHALSHGINGLFGVRNSPGIFNMAWKPAYFWDGGVNNLESQPQNPIENPVEMDLSLTEALQRLNDDATYRQQFKDVFGGDKITSQQLFKAFAQFMGAIVSANSKYDKYVHGTPGGTFTEQEQRGLNTFKDKCGSCHKEPLFTDYSYRNNGLAPSAALQDSGRAHITGDAADRNKFMVPSLRNVELTRPYMHDGRLYTLDAVVEHYRTGIAPSSTLDPLLAAGINMTDSEKDDIVAFLKTLTDRDLIKDKRFSQPR